MSGSSNHPPPPSSPSLNDSAALDFSLIFSFPAADTVPPDWHPCILSVTLRLLCMLRPNRLINAKNASFQILAEPADQRLVGWVRLGLQENTRAQRKLHVVSARTVLAVSHTCHIFRFLRKTEALTVQVRMCNHTHEKRLLS